MYPISSKEVQHTTFSSLGKIAQSPYEGNTSAEVGEQLFEYTLSLMDPERGLGSACRRIEGGPSDEAIEVFGEDLAEKILETNRHVSSSGILYGCGWTEGDIHGWRCGPLKKHLLLLCLRDHRIARSSVPGLKQVIKDLKVIKIVSKAMSRWKLGAEYPRMARCNEINSFRKKQTHCFKCILFIARAAICMQVLRWDFLAIADDTSLKQKIKTCFDILEKHVSDMPKKEKPRKPQKMAAQEGVSLTDIGSLASPDNQHLHNSDGGNDHTTNATIVRAHLPLSSCPENISSSELNNDYTTEQNGANNSNNHNSDPSRLLRTKGCRISRIHFEPESGKKRRKSYTTTEHGVTKPELSRAVSDETFYTNTNFNLPNKNSKNISHALFATTNEYSQKSDQRKIVSVPKHLALATKQVGLRCISAGSSTNSSSSADPNFWYPVDEEELILNPLQIEFAWLLEESMYCTRKSVVDWVFVMTYASPALQIELRQLPDLGDQKNGSCEEALPKMFYNGIEAKRFAIFRREVRRKLLKNVVRIRMQGILPRLRKATHPLRLKKMAARLASLASPSSLQERHE